MTLYPNSEHLGRALTAAMDDPEGEIIIPIPTGKRPANAKRKGETMTQQPSSYTIGRRIDGWYVDYTDGVRASVGPYVTRDAAVNAALIFQGREGRDD